MSVEKMMEEFKVWAAKASFPLDMRDDGHFLYMETRNAWHGWRGRHESIEVGLPVCEYANDSSEYSKGHRQGIRSCRTAIESLGLKVRT